LVYPAFYERRNKNRQIYRFTSEWGIYYDSNCSFTVFVDHGQVIKNRVGGKVIDKKKKKPKH